MTIHQKALEILSYYSSQKSVTENDNVSVLTDRDAIIKSLNILYETNVSLPTFKGFYKIANLISFWERETSLNISEQSAKIQSKIDSKSFPFTYEDYILKNLDQNQNADLFVVNISIVKPFHLYIFFLYVATFVLYFCSFFSESIMTLLGVLLCFIAQYFILSINFHIPFKLSELYNNSFSIEGQTHMQVPIEDLLVPYSELNSYYKQQRNYFYYLLSFSFVSIICYSLPFLNISDRLISDDGYILAISFSVVIAFIFAVIHLYVFIVYAYRYYESSVEIRYRLLSVQKVFKDRKQDNLAISYEHSSENSYDKEIGSLYLMFDEKSRTNALKIKKELDCYFSHHVKIICSKEDDTLETRLSFIENAVALLCFIDNNFVSSKDVMQELIYASNLNKTITAGCYQINNTPSNISKYIRRQIHSLDSIDGYNSLVLDLLPLLGCSEPLADAVGEHYELHVTSSNPYVISFDDKNYNFSSNQTIHLFFKSGNHNILIYNTKDIIVKRTVNVNDCSTLSKKTHYVDRIDLDGIFIERK